MSAITWVTLLQTLGVNPLKFMIWLFQPVDVVTFACMQLVPWVAFVVTKVRAALVPLQLPFSAALSQPLKSEEQTTVGVGLEVRVKVPVAVPVQVMVEVKVAVGRVPVAVAVTVGVEVAVDVGVGLAVEVAVTVGVKVTKD